MLIGAVETVTSEEVSGWVHSHLTDLEGALALAFVDGACVGSGRVGILRKDLADAGLSHGKLGFHFPVSLPDEDAAGRLVIGLEGCEAVILQRGSKVVGGPRAEAPALVGADLPSAETIAWLRKRQAISKDESDFLTSLGEFGVAAWALQSGRAEAGGGLAVRHDQTARGIIQLRDMAGTRVGQAEFSDAEEFAAALDAEDHPVSRAGLLVFSADRALTLTVVEGSHRLPKRKLIEDALDRGIRYTSDPANLLAVHRLCAFRLEQRPHTGPFTVFYPEEHRSRGTVPGRAEG